MPGTVKYVTLKAELAQKRALFVQFVFELLRIQINYIQQIMDATCVSQPFFSREPKKGPTNPLYSRLRQINKINKNL